MATPMCEHCDGPMPLLSRPSLARFCSGRCRTAAHRARRRVPTEMTRRDRWVRRTARKVPVACDGKAASSTDPATWCSYQDAVRSKAGAGVGFVLNGDGIACIDLDHCLDADGHMADWARQIVGAAGETWVERSVSGDGLHIWGWGSVPSGRRLRLGGGGSAEVYSDRRYIAVTGDSLEGSARRLGDISGVIRYLIDVSVVD